MSLQEAGCLEITVVYPNSQYTWEGDILYLAFWSRKHSVALLIWQAVWKWKGGWILGDITLNIVICMFYFTYVYGSTCICMHQVYEGPCGNQETSDCLEKEL